MVFFTMLNIVLFTANIVLGIINNNWTSVLGWSAALIYLLLYVKEIN